MAVNCINILIWFVNFLFGTDLTYDLTVVRKIVTNKLCIENIESLVNMSPAFIRGVLKSYRKETNLGGLDIIIFHLAMPLKDTSILEH